MTNEAKAPRSLLRVSAKLLRGGTLHLCLIAAVVFAQRLALVLSVLSLSKLGPRKSALLLLGAGALSVLRSRAAFHLTRRVRNNLLAFYLEPFVFAPAPLLPRGEIIAARLSIALSTLVAYSVDGIAVLLGASLALIPLLYWLSQELGPMALLPIGTAGILGAASTLVLSSRVEKSWSHAFEHARILLADISAAFEGAVDLRAHGQQNTYKHSLLERASQWSGAEGQARLQSAASRWGTLAFTLGTALGISALVSPQLFSDEREGGIYKTFLLVIACIPTLQSISGSIANLWYSRNDLEYLSGLENQFRPFAEISDRKYSENPEEPIDSSAGLQLDQIEFKYPAAPKPVFQKALSQEIPARGLITITGKNGAGKTTLLYLLLGLFEPTRGRIFAGEKEIHLRNSNWQKSIAFLSQRPFQRKDASLAQNLRAFDPDSPDQNLLSALEQVGMLDTLKKRAGSEKALLSMPLSSLSSGEARRVLLARVLLRKADTLILDEPDVHLDREGKERLGALLKAISKHKRVIVAAHDPLFLNLCDLHIALEP